MTDGLPQPRPRALATVTGSVPQRTTPFQLRRLLIALIAVTALAGAAGVVLQRGLESTAQAVRDTTSPAYLDGVQARAALSDADRAAWQSFRSGEAQFTGPGQQYQNDITTAGQALQRLGALEASNSADGSLLQTISGQLVNYEGLVEEADAEYRTDVALGVSSKDDLGFVYLGYASSALRDPQGGLLASISLLVGPEQQTLGGEMASPWADPALLLIFVIPALALLAGIAAAQTFLRRRFRRLVSPPLLAAAVLTIGLSGWMITATLHADSAFARARSTAFPAVTTLWQVQTNEVTAEAAALQSGKLQAIPDRASGGLNAAATAQASSGLDADLATADDTGSLRFAIPVLALVIGALTYLAIRPRLGEYRGTR